MARRNTNITLNVTGGNIPDFGNLKLENKDYNREYYRAEAYIRYKVDNKSLKKETIKWMEENTEYDTAGMVLLDDWKFAIVGKLCYMLNRKGELTDDSKSYIDRTLLTLRELAIERLGEEKDTVKSMPSTKKSVQHYMFEKVAIFCGEFEGWVDEFIIDPKSFNADKYDPLTMMRVEGFSQGHARYVLGFYSDSKTMIESAISGDTEITEYYSEYTKPQLKQLLAMYEKILDAADMIIKSSKATRKPRKKKVTPASKMVEKLKYLKEDTAAGLVSINPTAIIGAKELWFYNVKLRKLGKFVAFDESGLGVKGTTIDNFNTDKSVQKTLRKPTEQLKEFKTGGIRKFNKHFSDINSMEIKLKGRLNDNIILLKVFK